MNTSKYIQIHTINTNKTEKHTFTHLKTRSYRTKGNTHLYRNTHSNTPLHILTYTKALEHTLTSFYTLLQTLTSTYKHL